MLHSGNGFQAAKSLKAVLISRLQDRDAGSTISKDIMKAVQLCDKFLTAANGSQAELEVLKSVVKQTLAKQASVKRRTASIAVSRPSSNKPSSPASLASSGSRAWPPMPGILVEPKAHVQCGDFDKMVLMQDDMAHKEVVKGKQRMLSKQAATRKVLEDQLADIQKDKAAAREQKKREAAELKQSMRQYEEEEVQRWQQQKDQQAKTKQMYSQQVADARERHRQEAQAALHEQEMERQQLAEEERQAAAAKAAKVEDDKVQLAKTLRENEAYLQRKAQAAQQAKEEEQRLNKEYQASMERQEQKRIQDAKDREAKSRRKYEMAGGNDLALQLAEAARLSEAKTARQQAEHEAQQEVAMLKKKQEQQRQQQLILQVRKQQVQERKQQRDQEQADALRLAQQISQQKQQYDDEMKAQKAAMKGEKKALLRELEQGYKADTKRRFQEQRGLVDSRDEWVHKAVLQGKAPAFV